MLASNSCSTQRCAIKAWYIRSDSRPTYRETGYLPAVYNTLFVMMCAFNGYMLSYLNSATFTNIGISLLSV